MKIFLRCTWHVLEHALGSFINNTAQDRRDTAPLQRRSLIKQANRFVDTGRSKSLRWLNGLKIQFFQLLLRPVTSTVDDARLRRLVATFQLRLQKSQCLGNLEKYLSHYVRNGYGVITDPVGITHNTFSKLQKSDVRLGYSN